MERTYLNFHNYDLVKVGTILVNHNKNEAFIVNTKRKFRATHVTTYTVTAIDLNTDKTTWNRAISTFYGYEIINDFCDRASLDTKIRNAKNLLGLTK